MRGRLAGLGLVVLTACAPGGARELTMTASPATLNGLVHARAARGPAGPPSYGVDRDGGARGG